MGGRGSEGAEVLTPGQLAGPHPRTAIRLDPPPGRLPKSGRQILAISGELDSPDSRAAGDILVERAGARHVVVAGVAHTIAKEAPEAVAPLIVEFLEPLRHWS